MFRGSTFALALIVTVLVTAVVTSLVTSWVVYPMAQLAAEAAIRAEAQAKERAVAAAAEAQRVAARFKEREAVTAVCSALKAGQTPLRPKATKQENLRVMRRNFEVMESSDVSACPQDFQQAYLQAALAARRYIDALSQAPLPIGALAEDAMEIWGSGGVDLPVVARALNQVGKANLVIAAQADAMEHAKSAILRLQQVAVRYGATLSNSNG